MPKNSHFSSFFDRQLTLGLDVVIPITGLSRIEDFDVNGEWDNLSFGNMTYVMLPPGLDEAWLQSQLEGIYDRHYADELKDAISSIYARPLPDANLGTWDAIGLPLVMAISVLSLPGPHRCMRQLHQSRDGAGARPQPGGRHAQDHGRAQRAAALTQFLVESTVIATIAMLIALAILEVVIPLFNNLANKVMVIDYLRTLPWLVATTLLVGLFAGAYPAWLITRATPIDALRDEARKGKKGSTMRSIMIGAQFAISAFMLALVAVVYVQNEKVEDSQLCLPAIRDIHGLTRLQRRNLIQDRLDTLEHELEVDSEHRRAWPGHRRCPTNRTTRRRKVTATAR